MSNNKFNFISNDELENQENITNTNEEDSGLSTSGFTSILGNNLSEDNNHVEEESKISPEENNIVVEENNANSESNDINMIEDNDKKNTDELDKKYDVTDHFDVSEEDVVREEYEEEEESSSNYFGFEKRVAVMIIVAIVLFIVSIFFVVLALDYSKIDNIDYNEKSDVKYQVCSGVATMNENCYDEGLQYNSNYASKVKIDYNYKNVFSDSVNYDLSYYIEAVTEVRDSNNVLKYTNSEILKEKTPYNGEGDSIDISEYLDIDYLKYKNIITPYYMADNNVNADLVIKLVLDETKEKRDAAVITIPLVGEDFNVKTDKIENSDTVKVITKKWTDKNSMYIAIAAVFLGIAIIVIYKLYRLILKVTNNKNVYQKVLDDILREYDRIIVVARDGYESNVKKTIIKVASFEELLDARDALEKPIIFSKINNVKSEFIVEDDTKLYKYILKEADIVSNNN